MDDKVLLGLMGIVFLVLQFIFQMVTRRSSAEVISASEKGNAKLLERLDKVIEAFDSRTADITRELKEEIQSKRAGYDDIVTNMAKGIQETVIKINSSEVLHHEISQNILKTTICNKSVMKIIERMDKKLDVHAVDCDKRNKELQNIIER